MAWNICKQLGETEGGEDLAYIYIYIYMCVCMCVRARARARDRSSFIIKTLHKKIRHIGI
jgi:hypothetical protein